MRSSVITCKMSREGNDIAACVLALPDGDMQTAKELFSYIIKGNFKLTFQAKTHQKIASLKFSKSAELGLLYLKA